MLTPHKNRRSAIHAVILAILAFALASYMFSSCVTQKPYKDPCKGRRGMIGYGYKY